MTTEDVIKASRDYADNMNKKEWQSIDKEWFMQQLVSFGEGIRSQEQREYKILYRALEICFTTLVQVFKDNPKIKV